MNGIPENQTLGFAPDAIVRIGIERKCSRCRKIKLLFEFHKCISRKYGRSYLCKICVKEIDRKKYSINKKRINEYHKSWVAENKDICNKISRKSYALHRESRKERLRKWHKENPGANKKWRTENPEKVRATRRKSNAKETKTTKGKLNRSMRGRIWRSLKGSKKNRRWENLVNYTVEQLKRHLEKQFLFGMTWENYGTYWHIDHKIPISVFNFEKPENIDFKRCWCLKNLQPLEAEKNLRKHDKIEKPFQPFLRIG